MDQETSAEFEGFWAAKKKIHGRKLSHQRTQLASTTGRLIKAQFILGRSLDVVFRQIEIVLKDSTTFVYVTKSEKSSHFTLMT